MCPGSIVWYVYTCMPARAPMLCVANVEVNPCDEVLRKRECLPLRDTLGAAVAWRCCAKLTYVVESTFTFVAVSMLARPFRTHRKYGSQSNGVFRPSTRMISKPTLLLFRQAVQAGQSRCGTRIVGFTLVCVWISKPVSRRVSRPGSAVTQVNYCL